MHRRFQIDLDSCGAKNIKYSGFISGIVGCIDKYDDRGVVLNTNNRRYWCINTYYAGAKIISPTLEINQENYDLLDRIFKSLDINMAKFIAFEDRRMTYNLEVFDLYKPQIASLLDLFSASIPVFFKLNRENMQYPPFNFDLHTFDPEKITAQQPHLYKLFQEYFPISVSKFNSSGIISFTIARSTLKSTLILNWAILFNHMIEQCKKMSKFETYHFEPIMTGKEFIKQLEITDNNKPLSDWILEKCAE
jgi:hypothetical protein